MAQQSDPPDTVEAKKHRRPAGLGQAEPLAADGGGQRSNSAILGDIVWLMLQAPMYRKWSLAGVERYVLPAIHHRQFRLYHRGDIPIGYVSWAKFSDAVEKEYIAGKYALKPEDWIGGDNVWIVDCIAPYGDINSIRMHMRKERPYGGTGIVKGIRPFHDGRGQRVVEFGPYRKRKQHGWSWQVTNRK